MLRARDVLRNNLRSCRHCYSILSNGGKLPLPKIIAGSIDSIAINDFREQAFLPETPILITPRAGRTPSSTLPVASKPLLSIPAAHKWVSKPDGYSPLELSEYLELSHPYLAKFGESILPYELVIDSREDLIPRWIEKHGAGPGKDLAAILAQLFKASSGETFHRFNAPLSLFLRASELRSPTLQRLYIAQAQISDLPIPLQEDLPTPRLVKEGGKGDVYDANIWMGLPPTYTPLHKDPNPNLFVQLASTKMVRLFDPATGASMFREVQRSIGQQSSASFRGNEMMEGPEKELLYERIWGSHAPTDGLETSVGAGDALFIPKGWWHSIKSVGAGVTISVNWWFR